MGRPLVSRRISASTPGAIVQPQPPPCENEVSRTAPARSLVVVIVVLAPWTRRDGQTANYAPARAPHPARAQGQRARRAARSAGATRRENQLRCAPARSVLRAPQRRRPGTGRDNQR